MPPQYQFSEDFLATIKIYKMDLKKLYLQYASIKGNEKNATMNSFQFIWFLKDCKIVRQSTDTNNIESSLLTKEADIIYTQLTHLN